MEQSIFDTNIEIEFLRTLILEGDLIYEVKSSVTPEMLSSTPHEHIYRAIDNLAERNVGISREILLGELNDKGWIEKAGGIAYLDGTILNGRPNSRGIKEHVKRIQNNYKRRKLHEINSAIPSLLDRNEDVNRVISRVNKTLDDLISSVGTNKQTVAIGDVLPEYVEKIIARKDNPQLPGYSTGLGSVDNITSGIMEGEIWYVAARPSMGKSAFVLKTLLEMTRNGIPCMLFSQEMSQEQLINRFVSIISGVPLQTIRSGMGMTEEDTIKIAEAQEEYNQLPLYIDSSFGASIDEIIAMVRKYNQLYGIKVVGIDYIQIVVERGGDATAELGRASRLLKLLSNELNISVVILSQLNREVEKRDNKRPLMADMRQSGNLEEDADIMVALYRDEVYLENSPDAGTMEFIVRKNRNGPIGTVRLNFDKETVNITDTKKTHWV